MIRSFLVLAVGAMCVLSSCITAKQVTYFQDANPKQSTPDSISKALYDTLAGAIRIQPFDILDIRVTSSDKAMENLTENKATVATTASSYVSAFLVDEYGDVNLPYIGRFKLKGYTIQEARDKLREKLLDYLTDPYIDIKFLTFKVTMLGEFSRSGVITVPNERANLIDAIGLAGDLTTFGDSRRIKVLRGDPGNPKVYLIDLTKVQSFKSEGFILKPNDIVYAEPLRRKFFVNNVTTVAGMVTLLNTATILYTLFFRK